MLLHLIRKELLDQLLSLRFALACVVCLVVFLLSSLVLARDYREAMSTYNMNRVVHRNELQQRTEVWSLNQGVTVDRPLNVMNVLVRGLTSELTESIRVQQGNRLDFPETYEQNPVLPLFPEVDFVFIIGVIVSLLALAFAYDSVSGERESGVLKLMMSYSVPRDLVLLGKWIGGYLALITPMLTAFVASLLMVLLFPEVEASTSNTLAILGLLILALLYVAAIFSLGLFVSCRTSLTSTSITVLLLIWVALILAVPNMSPYVTSQVIPVPSRLSVDREKAELQRVRERAFRVLVEEWKEEKGLGEEDNWWQDQDLRTRAEEHWSGIREEMQKVEDGYQAKVRNQTRWSGIVARISPLTSFVLASLDMSSAGLNQEEAFVEALKSYSQTWSEYSEEKQKAWREFMEERSRSGGRMSFNSADMEQFNNLDLSDYPRFEFEYLPVAERLSQIYTDILLLVIWNILFFMAAYLSFLRYEVQ